MKLNKWYLVAFIALGVLLSGGISGDEGCSLFGGECSLFPSECGLARSCLTGEPLELEPVDLLDGNGTAMPTTPQTFTINPLFFRYPHKVGVNKCPDKVTDLSILGPKDYSWDIVDETIPSYLDFNPLSSKFTDLPIKVGVSFNCAIPDISTHTEKDKIRFNLYDPVGGHAGELDFQIDTEITGR